MEPQPPGDLPAQRPKLDSPPPVLDVIYSRLAKKRRATLQDEGVGGLAADNILATLGFPTEERTPGDTAEPANIIAILEGVDELRKSLPEEGESYEEKLDLDEEEAPLTVTGFKDSVLDDVCDIDITLNTDAGELSGELYIDEVFEREGSTVSITLGEPTSVPGYKKPHFPYEITITYRDRPGLPPAKYVSKGYSYEMKDEDIAIISDALARIAVDRERRKNLSDADLEGYLK